MLSYRDTSLSVSQKDCLCKIITLMFDSYSLVMGETFRKKFIMKQECTYGVLFSATPKSDGISHECI